MKVFLGGEGANDLGVIEALLAKAKAMLHATGVTTTSEMVDVVDAADFAKLPADATSLRTWIARAQR